MLHRKRKALKIISGGQTGADRAALDFALKYRFKHGGFCPAGRKAEDGTIPTKYKLTETKHTAFFARRTSLNVLTSDLTLIFICDKTDRGTKATLKFCRRYRKYCFTLNGKALTEPHRLMHFLKNPKIRIINIAGPRASVCPHIHNTVYNYLRQLLLV